MERGLVCPGMRRRPTELLDSSDSDEDDDFHARRRAFRARGRGDGGAAPAGRAGVAASLLSKLSDGPGSGRAAKEKAAGSKGNPKAALPTVKPPTKRPDATATDTSGSSASGGRTPRVDLVRMRQEARETTKGVKPEQRSNDKEKAGGGERQRQARPPAQKRASDGGRTPKVSPRISGGSTKATSKGLSKKPSAGSTSTRAAQRGAAAAGGSGAAAAKPGGGPKGSLMAALGGGDGEQLTGLARLRKAASKVVIANRLGNYVKTDTGRRPEEARKKAEKKQLKVVWKSVDVDGGGTLDRYELRQVLKKMGKTLTEEQLDKTMRQVDEDGSGEVEFEEFEAWWDRHMSSEAAVPPTPFNFGGQCVRALKVNGGNEFWWVASDLSNVLFPPDPVGGEMSEEQKEYAKQVEQKKLRAIWKKVDTDGSGELDWDELKQVFRQMGREMTDVEMDKALSEIDKDGGGEVDFDEFKKWWDKQDQTDKRQMEKQKAFESLLESFQPGDFMSILLSTPSGPEDAKLVSPQGLFRLVLRAKS